MDLFFQTNKLPANEKKLRGGYYTPPKLADFLVRWTIREDTFNILEPSCGDGNFIIPVLERLHQLGASRSKLVAVEIETDELLEAKKRTVEHFPGNGQVDWRLGDFFEHFAQLKKEGLFDAILGNPPFIRFQHVNNESRETAFRHLREANYKPTKLANIWAAFVQLSIEMLKPDGRMAFVLPAELLQVKYAEELRNRLVSSFRHIIIIGFKKLVFPEIQQEVVLLLAEGKRLPNGICSDIHTLELEKGDELFENSNLENTVAHFPAKHSHKGMKWTSLFLSEGSYQALEEAAKAPGLVRLGQIAEVDIGIVTGRNSFFVIDKKRRDALEAQLFSVPILGRTNALKSLIFSEADFEDYSVSNPAYLLNLNAVHDEDIPPAILKYIAHGEKEAVHEGYKCRIRKRWFNVPSIYVPDAFLFRQIHRFPLLVVNQAKAASTDTVHRVRLKPGIEPEKLACAFFNSLTLAWSEVAGRSYGGGVLELEPGEANELLLPYNAKFDFDVEKVDALLKNGQETAALDYVDDIVLKDYLGFDRALILKIRRAWEELRDRRINRK